MTGTMTLAPTSSAANLIVSQGPGVTPLTIRAASAQTANLLTVSDSGGVPLTAFNSAGGLKILTDGGNSDLGSIVLENRTVGASPAAVPSINLKKDGVYRWQLGIDVTPGSQGDLDLYHYLAAQPSGSADILYVTDEKSPKVGIRGDRFVPATLTVYAQADQPTLVLGGTQNQGADLGQFGSGGSGLPTFSVAATGILRMAQSSYTPRPSEASHVSQLLYNANGQLTFLPTGGALTSLAPDMRLADSHNMSLGTGTGTSIGAGPGAKLAFFGRKPIATPVLSYSRTAAGETPAEAALRSVLAGLGLVVDNTRT